MKRIIKSMETKYEAKSLDLVEQVFTEYDNEQEGKLVRSLVEEIRNHTNYLPELELIMVDELDEVIGYVMFSRFSLEGKYADELLLLSPAAVRTSLQRQHISKELIEYGFQEAKKMGFSAVLVEGNPANYRARGFKTAADYDILAGKTVHLPSIDCLMATELVEGALNHIHGYVEYDCYKSLT